MSTISLITIHIQIFAGVALAMSAVVVVRNAFVLFALPTLKNADRWRPESSRAQHRNAPTGRSAIRSTMPGRTRPVSDFYEYLQTPEGRPTFR